MKKILIFSLSYHPRFIGGAEVAIKEITDRISPEDITFHMVTLRYDSNLAKAEKVGNIMIYRIGFGSPNPNISDLKKFPLFFNKFIFQFSAAFFALKLHKENKYDGVWAMMAHSCAVPSGIFNMITKVPYVLTLQEGDPPEYIKRKMLPIYPLFVSGFRRAKIVQTISTFLLNWGRDMGFKGEGVVVPNGVDTNYFSEKSSEDELENLRGKLGKINGDVFLITTSRLVKKNAVNNVIESLEFLPKKYKFIILGIGPDEKMLKDLARSLDVSERVIFLGDIPNNQVQKYLQISEIFIRPSLSEGMGNVFIEAMAAGVPVISTQEGGIADFLFDPELNKDKDPTGLAVKVNDPEGIARQAKRLIEDKNLRDRIVKNAQKMVFEKYDWNLIAKNMKEKVFDRIY